MIDQSMKPPAQLRESLQRLPQMAPSLITFNFEPARYLHHSHRSLLLPEIPEQVWNVSRVVHRLSRLILLRTGLDQCICVEAPHVLWPIALLPTDRLERLAIHVGAHVLGFRIRSSLARTHVREWKEKLGDDAYRFVMTSAALLPASKLLPPELDRQSPAELGMSVIVAAFEGAPEGMYRRVALKLPANINPLPLESGKARKLTQMVADIVEAEWFSSLVMLRR